MANHVVVCMQPMKNYSIQASNRIAWYVIEQLKKIPGVNVFHCSEESEVANLPEEIDVMWYIQGVAAFCGYVHLLKDLTRRSKFVVSCKNDHNHGSFPSQINQVTRDEGLNIPVVLISTLESDTDGSQKDTHISFSKSMFLNWNQLTYVEMDSVPWEEDALFYYGAFRKDREKKFQRFFDTEKFRVVVSATSVPAGKKFLEIDPKIEIVQKSLNLMDDIQKYKASLYLQDKRNDTKYGCPANRFYECVSAGVPVLFEERSRMTMEKAGFSMRDDFFVGDSQDLALRLSDDKFLEDLRLEQLTLFRKQNFRQKLDEEFKACLDKILEMSGA